MKPGKGARDIQLVKTLRKRTGHAHFGVLAVVVESGPMATGDSILLDAGQ